MAKSKVPGEKNNQSGARSQVGKTGSASISRTSLPHLWPNAGLVIPVDGWAPCLEYNAQILDNNFHFIQMRHRPSAGNGWLEGNKASVSKLGCCSVKPDRGHSSHLMLTFSVKPYMIIHRTHHQLVAILVCHTETFLLGQTRLKRAAFKPDLKKFTRDSGGNASFLLEISLTLPNIMRCFIPYN